MSFLGVFVILMFGFVVGLFLIDSIVWVLSVDSMLVFIGVFGFWVMINYDLFMVIYRIE